MSDNLPATQATTNPLAMPEEWAELAGAFDDGSKRFREHFGLTVPRLRSDFGKGGKGWIDDATNEVYDALEVIILAYPPSRSWWEVSIDEGGGGGRPDCSSLDMIAPLASSPKRQSELCGNCRWSKWGDDGEPPACAESANVLSYDTNNCRFVWLRFGRTALQPFRKYISNLESRSLPAFAVATVLTLEEKRDGSKQWLIPRFGLGEALKPADVAPMRQVAQMAMQNWQQVAEEMSGAEAGPFDGAVDAKASDAGRPFVDVDGSAF